VRSTRFVAIALLGLLGCGLPMQGTGDPEPAGDGSDATAPSAPAATPSAPAVGEADAGIGPGAQSAPDGGGDGGACTGVMCGGQCAASCEGCAAGTYDCHGTCVPSCGQCNGGADFVVCLVCAAGGPLARQCSAATSGGCLDGTYDHCPCVSDTNCSEGNQRCIGNVCTACGEQTFGRTSCNQGSCCCSSGATLGQCSCGCGEGG
jgi:hypothetical protein